MERVISTLLERLNAKRVSGWAAASHWSWDVHRTEGSNDLGSNDLESLAQLDEAGDIYSEETDNGLLELKELNFPSSRGNC